VIDKNFHYRMTSPVGNLLLGAHERGLRFLYFDDGRPIPDGWESIESRRALAPYIDQVTAYFRGELRQFTCPLDLEGTEFQRKCWEALRLIPYGTTCTYAELAREVGHPKAVRAVGQANHRNPAAIIVPCHRVIGADGTLTGYGGGLPIKEMLLRFEGALPQLGLAFSRDS
jgi:methylated-DNA-[protein]-cysteine S-methyltransferase